MAASKSYYRFIISVFTPLHLSQYPEDIVQAFRTGLHDVMRKSTFCASHDFLRKILTGKKEAAA